MKTKKVKLLFKIIYILIPISYIFFGYSIINYINTVKTSISHLYPLIALSLIYILLYFLLSHIKKQVLKDDDHIFKIKRAIINNKIKFIGTLILVLFLSFTLLVTFQRNFMYFPNYYNDYHEELIESSTYNEISIESGKSIYTGIYKNNDSNKTIIHFHGNAESSALVFKRLENSNTTNSNFNIIIMDYPTYGKSKGKLSESNNYKMADAIYNYVVNNEEFIDHEIIISGYSIGTGIATYLAATTNIKKLVLVAPYTSLTDVINTRLPFFYGPLKKLIKDQYNSLKKASSINAETLVIASHSDNVIKYSFSEKLNSAIENSTLISYENIKHNEFIKVKDFYIQINNFLLN